MKEVKSKFSVEIILTFFLLLLISGGGIAFIVSSSISGISGDKYLIKKILLFPFLSVGFVLTIRYIILRMGTVTIYPEGIRFHYLFKNTFLCWNEMEYINLTGKRGMFLFIFAYNYDAVHIESTAGSEYFIPYNFYSNHRLLLHLMEQVQNLKEKNTRINTIILYDSIPDNTVSSAMSDHLEGKKYRGSIFRSLAVYACLFMLILPCMIATALLTEGNTFILLLPLGALILYYWILGARFSYFIVSENHIQFKNIFYFWRSKVYAFKEIREMAIEQRSNTPFTVKIITKDFRRKSFACDGMKKKKWNEFVEEMHGKNVSLSVDVPLS